MELETIEKSAILANAAISRVDVDRQGK